VLADVSRRRWAATLGDEFASGDCHAGSYESSIVMAADPSSVREKERAALAPVAIGLILASGYTLARGADRSPGAFALTLVATAALAFTRVNPVWVLLLAALAGVAGLA